MTPAQQSPAIKQDASRVVLPRPLESGALFGGRDEVLIAHGGEIYRLRRTRQGKLILTK